MERIGSKELFSGGRKNYEGNENAEWQFLEAGYFHVDDCEGDHSYYYRYVVSGEIWEMNEQDVHCLKRMSPVERKKVLIYGGG